MKGRLVLLALSLACGCAAQSSQTGALRQVGTIELPGVQGRLDHLAVDLQGRRLFVAALGNNTVEVIDLAAGRVAHTIEGLREPQGIVYLPRLDQLVVTNGAGASVSFFDGRTYRLLQTVPLRADPDNVRLEAGTGDLYVGEGTGPRGALAVLDAAQGRVSGEIPLAGHPESFQLEEGGGRLFVNVPAARHVAVVDRQRRVVLGTWPLDEAGANFPMALDEAHHRLFVGTRQPARLLVLETETGKTISTLTSAADADDIFYDAERQRLYISGGTGAITVIEQVDADTYRRLEEVHTGAGARTSLWVPAWHRLYLAVPRDKRQSAVIRIYETSPSG